MNTAPKSICPASQVRRGAGISRAGRTLATRLWGLLALALCLCLNLSLLPAPAQAAGEPTGSWTNYADTAWYKNAPADATKYTISTAEELAGVAKLSTSFHVFNGKTIALTADIDLSAHYWPGIKYFSGFFDGGGHTISSMIQQIRSADSTDYVGFFMNVQDGFAISNLRLYSPSISIDTDFDWMYTGLLIGQYDGTTQINNCVVEQAQVTLNFYPTSEYGAYVGGLVGKSYNRGTMKASNCSVVGLAVTAKSDTWPKNIYCAGLGPGSYENCFVSVEEINIPEEGKFAYLGFIGSPNEMLFEATDASSCYWLDSGLKENSQTTGTECYEVTPEQVTGTGSKIIGSSYANTPSLVTAMNNWVDAQAGNIYTTWALSRRGAPLPSLFLPTYIDISGPLDDLNHQSATGDIQAGVDLEGQIQEQVTLLSVTIPASIPFVLDVDDTGVFKRLLSARGTLINRSDCAVGVTLETVEPCDKLALVNLYLVPDPVPQGYSRTALAEGDMKLPLGELAAGPDTPTSFTMQMEGDGLTPEQLTAAGLSGQPSLGRDGETFTVNTTFKVTRKAPVG